jgi:hypothetical protein
MLLRELFVDEGVMTILGKSGNKTVRKYRCTSGSRKGRIVAKPSTCTAAKNIRAAQTLKTTRRKKGKALSIKSSRTKRTNPSSIRLKSLNTGRSKTLRPKKRRGSKGKRI